MAVKGRQQRHSWGRRRKLPSGRWQAAYTGPDCSLHKAPHTFPTKLAAESWLAHERQLIDYGTWTPLQARRDQAERVAITVGQWLDRFHDSLAHGPTPLRPSTLAKHRQITANRITCPIGPGGCIGDITRLADIPVIDLTKGDVYRWWGAVIRAYPDTAPTNQKAYARLRAAMSEAVRQELISCNPVDIPEAARRVKPAAKVLPTDAELAAIMAEVPPRFRVVTSLTLFHGLRIGEALALESGDVSVVDDISAPGGKSVSVVVRQNVQRVTGADGHTVMVVQPPKTPAGLRRVPIMPMHVPMFLEHIGADYGGPVMLPTDSGQRREFQLLTTSVSRGVVWDTDYRTLLGKVRGHAGVVRNITPHCGRGWVATKMAEAGFTLKEIGEFLGDDDPATLLGHYMKVRPGRLEAAAERLSSGFDPGVAVGE